MVGTVLPSPALEQSTCPKSLQRHLYSKAKGFKLGFPFPPSSFPHPMEFPVPWVSTVPLIPHGAGGAGLQSPPGTQGQSWQGTAGTVPSSHRDLDKIILAGEQRYFCHVPIF